MVGAARPGRPVRRAACGLVNLLMAAALLPACHGGPHLDLVVTTVADAHDANPGDGVCEIVPGVGDCSLRAAVDEINATPDVPAVVTLPTGTYPIVTTGSDNDNVGGDFDISGGTVTIVGAGPGAVIDANGRDQGIDARAGAVMLRNLAIQGASGAGVTVGTGASLAATRVSIHENGGHGVRIRPGATASLVDSTVGGNGGAGAHALGSLVTVYSTITRNAAGGLRGPGNRLVGTSIVADNAGAECAGAVTSADHNLGTDGTCGFTAAHDVVATSADLAPLSLDLVPSYEPNLGSPAHDSIALTPDVCGSGPITTDQRGQVRPQGVACDRGAVEVPGLIVDDPGDSHDLVPGDAVCLDASGACTLRAAIDEANADADADVIAVAPGVHPVLGLPGAHEDANATGDLDVTQDATIDGKGATIDGAGLDRVLNIQGPDVEVRNATITGGHASVADGGGGVRVDVGSLTLDRAHVVENQADLFGGGVSSNGVLHIVHSTIEANRAAGAGGVLVLGPSTIESSTITGNEAVGAIDMGVPPAGGGIGNGGDLTILNSTISGNVGEPAWGSGLYNEAGTVDVTYTTFYANDLRETFGGVTVRLSVFGGAGRSCLGNVVSGGFNLADDSSCGFVSDGDQPNIDPLLGPLADHGGPTLTHLPAPGSPAINSVFAPDAPPGTCDGTMTDQRGVVRPLDLVSCDKGSVEQ